MTVVGIVTDVSDVHPSNDWAPISAKMLQKGKENNDTDDTDSGDTSRNSNRR